MGFGGSVEGFMIVLLFASIFGWFLKKREEAWGRRKKRKFVEAVREFSSGILFPSVFLVETLLYTFGIILFAPLFSQT